jgi:hypothetical protein
MCYEEEDETNETCVVVHAEEHEYDEDDTFDVVSENEEEEYEARISLVYLESQTTTEQRRYNVPTRINVLHTNIRQTVAMSKNEVMEIDVDRGRGLRGTTDKKRSTESKRKQK